MGQPAVKKGDKIVVTDTHIVLVPSPGGPVPQPLPHPFQGIVNDGLSSNVKIMGMPAATVGSTAQNEASHPPTPPGIGFQKAPANKGRIKVGSATVTINGKAAARHGDMAESCNDPADLPIAKVMASGTVSIG